MGNCIPLLVPVKLPMKARAALPIQTPFKFPSPLPQWPSGGGFANGSIDLGGLEVRQISTFEKVWTASEGGQDNLGATFFKPSPIPSGFSLLGCYCQANSKPLFGWTLIGKVDSDDGGDDDESALAKPVDYTLVWSSESMKLKQDSNGYIWLPLAPEGYAAVGLILTDSAEKPSVDEIRCVRSDLTDTCETDTWIWGTDTDSNSSDLNVYSLRPTTRGIQALGVSVGTFIAQLKGNDSSIPLACLKNKDSNLYAMPNLTQIEALMQTFSPWVYFYKDEKYLPSSVSWFFNNGALLYKQGDSTTSPIDSTGSNLPQVGSNDGEYWLELPVDKGAKETVKQGQLQSAESYVHIKPMLGATFTDLAIWVFYPFNGPATLKVESLNVPLGRIGEHVGDWEHVTLRISNFNGELWRVYFSEHSSGRWVDASELEFQAGNKPVTYASNNGHALYSKPGLVLQGLSQLGVGIRNDTSKSNKRMDTGAAFALVAAEYLGSSIIEPPWLNYARTWGPKITYDYGTEIAKVVKSLPGELKTIVEDVVDEIPKEVYEEEGPAGPKMKKNWSGDEI